MPSPITRLTPSPGTGPFGHSAAAAAAAAAAAVAGRGAPAAQAGPRPAAIAELDWQALLAGPFTPSPSAWSEQVLYFLLVDRFSDGQEAGCRNAAGDPLPGVTPALTAADRGLAVTTEADAAAWRAAGASWVGGTLAGVGSKLGYLSRLGVTALWISPVLRQRPERADYHGYAVTDFLQVDPRFGTDDDLVQLVRDAHAVDIRVILDVIVNHTGDTFGYVAGDERPFDGIPRRVRGWRDGHGDPTLPFPAQVADPDAAIWPRELQADGVYTCAGPISHWDDDPEYRLGDFFGLKDVWHGSGPVEDYRPSDALRSLAAAYQYWVAKADLDGMRVDTVKHMDPGATRFFASAMHEFGRRIGKNNFFLVGEITGPRSFAIDLMELTGLDAALGLADLQGKLEATVTGWGDPGEYFGLFRNSALVGHGTHTWFGERVVTSIDDHDQVRKGDAKSRFAATELGRELAFAALATNVTTLGLPCLYYGSEQAFDGAGGNDRYIREAMFGGTFGAFRSTGRHCFDETHPAYVALARLLVLRRRLPVLRFGRQYQRPISGDGIGFGLPRRIGDGRMTSIVAWSRMLNDEEIVCAVNTDTAAERSAWVTVDAAIHAGTPAFRYLFASDTPESGLAGRSAPVESRNGRAVFVTVPPAGFVVLGAT